MIQEFHNLETSVILSALSLVIAVPITDDPLFGERKEARVSPEERSVCMGPVVIENQMDFPSARNGTVYLFEKLHELLMPVSWLAVANYRPVQDVQGSEQRGRTVSFIIVCLAFGDARPHWQKRLGSIQRLNLALLIHAQHQCLGRRVQVQPDDIAQFFTELWIFAEVELLNAVRLQAVNPPDAMYGRITYLGPSPCSAYSNVCRSQVWFPRLP